MNRHTLRVYNRKYGILGIVGLGILCVVSFITSHGSSSAMLYSLIIAVLCVIMIIRYNMVYLTVTDHDIAIKQTLLKPAVVIAFAQVTQIERLKNRLIIYSTDASLTKKTVVYLGGLEKQDEQLFFIALQPLLERFEQ